MTDSIDTIANRIRDLLDCSTVTQTPCLSHRLIRLISFDKTVNSDLYMRILCSRVMTAVCSWFADEHILVNKSN